MYRQRSLFGGAALAALLSIAAPVAAQPPQPPPPHARGQRGPRMEHDRGPRMEQRIERLVRELALTPEQQTVVRRIFEQARQRVDTARRQFPGRSPERRQVMRQVRFEVSGQIHDVLTPEQRERLYQLRRERMRERIERGEPPRHHRGGGRGHRGHR